MSMKRLLVLFLFLLLLGYVSALTPQEAMMEAWKTGNYSIVKPYLSPAMKALFTEKLFMATRNTLVEKYGSVEGYRLIREEKKDGYEVYYYRVLAEKGNYTVSVTVKGGRVEGFHLSALPLAPTVSGLLYPLAGAFLGFLVLWAYLRKFHGAELILGAVLLVPVLLFQSPLQMLPRFLGVMNLTFIVLWTGLIAALFQEPLKYYFSRDKSLGKALYIGIGFGIGEGIYVALNGLLLGGASPIALIERTLALLFHASTTVLFAYSYRNGWGKKALLAMVLIHWLADSIAAYWHVNPSTAVLTAGYAVMFLTALAILPKLLPLAKIEKEEVVRW
ncbi:hypothetical protein [Thermococcus sp.]